MKNTSRSTKKLLAVFMVLVMAFSSIAIIAQDDNDSVATVGDGGAYTYTLVYDSSTMSQTASQETQLSVAGMTPISHAQNTTTLTALANQGSWTWDYNPTTHEGSGKGPFNSFYGAFDIDNGNAFVTMLNPYNLGQDLSGNALPSGNYNIMWVLPTVYWKTDASGNITLTNDSTAGGTAYAHTINGHVYNYIAIGVYHGSKTTIDNGNTTVLTSKSGVAPTASQTRAVFRDQANNYTMDDGLSTDATNHPAYSMLWNFYQWELYKLCSYTVMEGFNSQMIVGNGNVYGGNRTMVTGGADTLGPYAGNPGNLGSDGSNAPIYGQNYTKLFIEEAWGTVYDFLDGVVINANQGFYVNTSATPTDYTSGSYVEYITQALPSSGFGATISTSNAKTWGFAETTDASTDYYNKGMTDKTYTTTSGSKVLYVGGTSENGTSSSVGFGLSCAITYDDLTASGNYIGSRLAFVFDAVPAPAVPTTVTIESNNTDYGTVDVASVEDVMVGSTITVSNNTITIGSTTITATPTTATAQYTYAFSNWSVANNDTVTEDMVITATFTQTLNSYTVTWKNYDNTTLETDASVPYGTVPTYDGATPTKASTTQYTYTFDTWTPTVVAVTGDATYTATFTETLRGYTVTWKNYDNTTLETDTNVPYGTTPTYDGATPTKPSTPEYKYTFDTWTPTVVAVSGDATYTATYTQSASVYNVTVVANNDEYGTITNGTFTDIPYGTSITINGNEVTIGMSGTATATENTDTPQYTYGFTDFTVSPSGSTVSADTTITANFTRTVNEYTITWSIDGVTTTETYEYGQTPTHANPTKEGYTFTGWNPTIASVTGDQTYTAQFEVNVYTVTWNANGGNVSPTSSTGSIETAVTVPTPTRDNFTFAGWYDAASEGNALVTPYYPTADITYYAHWTATLYTVTFDATTNGGTTEATTLQGTVETPVTLPTATKDGEHFDGWWTSNTSTGTRVGFADDLYYPTADITLVAKFNENPVYTNSLNFNANGGYGSPVTLTNSSDTPEAFEFTIPDTVPYRYLYDFVGWASTSTATEREYTAGDTIEVASGESVTLYAVWVAQDEHNQFKSLIDTIPIIVAVGLILGVVGLFIRFGNEGGISVANISASTLSSAIVGVAVAVLVFAFVMLPLLSGL